jgi:hypothetical protein
MEDVLDLYEEEYDPRYPTVCLDEKPVVLHEQTRPVLPLSPGRAARGDYEYVRRSTANLFVVVEPLAGWRQVTHTAQRAKVDYARQLRRLSDEIYPDAEYIRLVQDNLNTHTLASLYEVYPPAEARRIASRFEVHYTPKHGSWREHRRDPGSASLSAAVCRSPLPTSRRWIDASKPWRPNAMRLDAPSIGSSPPRKRERSWSTSTRSKKAKSIEYCRRVSAG